MNSALDPLLNAIQLELENYIFKMHSEDFTRWICFIEQTLEIGKLILRYRGIFVSKVYLISIYFKKSTPNVKISRKTFASISGILTFCHFSSTLSRDIADSPDAPCSGYIQDMQVRPRSQGRWEKLSSIAELIIVFAVKRFFISRKDKDLFLVQNMQIYSWLSFASQAFCLEI